MSSSPAAQDRQTTAVDGDRVTYREARATLEDLEALVDEGVFPNRSEAIRAATRQLTDEYSAALRGDSNGE